jgi:hypothetical protein
LQRRERRWRIPFLLSNGLPGRPIALSNGNGTFKVTNASDGGFYAYFAQSVVRAVPLNGCPAKIAAIGGGGWNTIPIATPNLSGAFTVTNKSDGGFNVFYWPGSSLQPVAGDFNGDGLGDIALTGVGAWNGFPIAYQQSNGTFTVTSNGETSGDTSFASDAAQPGAKALSK